ncbi:hypothetical protein IEQ34_026536 [Dendrobium chrysotoxum]|uniref:Uncharacterized protein n=1 Tax=Dendrobium chrysotoxum TaxID=161865 RepID=A0AAV7FLY8_DENCH|nr:hypothetical protein IEQ34_026536 [Dendrobium chrysotoxum]
MFYWSFHAHPTPSHPYRLPYKYIPILLRYAPIIVELGPCCYPEYMPSILFPGLGRKLSKEENEIFYKEIDERLVRLISDDDEEEELMRKNGAPPLSINGEEPQLFPRSDSFVDASCYGSFDAGLRKWQVPFGCGFPGMERKLSKEDNEIFYMEIEERLMRLISDGDDEGEELKRKNGAPPLSINVEEPQLFPRSDSFVDASCHESFDMGIMRQWQAPFGCWNCQRSAWLTYELDKVRRSALASGRKGTGVFIPRYKSA